MVMADRPDVRTASAPIAAVDTLGLAQQFANAMVRVPFRRPWDGPAGLAHNLGQTVTREMVRTFMGYSSSLPIEEFRSIERGLDDPDLRARIGAAGRARVSELYTWRQTAIKTVEQYREVIEMRSASAHR